MTIGKLHVAAFRSAGGWPTICARWKGRTRTAVLSLVPARQLDGLPLVRVYRPPATSAKVVIATRWTRLAFAD